MIEKVKELVRTHLGWEAENMRPAGEVTNNRVFTFESGEKSYIFKFYKSKYWPEDGKLPYIVSKLTENDISCAGIEVFTRENPDFPAGYLIEERISGISGDKAELDADKEEALYRKLAVFMSRVHRISLSGFGYICDGNPCYESMCGFFEDEFEERGETLIENGVFTEDDISALSEKFLGTLKEFDNLPPVLCHGDLSRKNIMLRDDGNIALIDWDDAMAYCWMADVSRFTFWLRLNYTEENSQRFRAAFLESYETDCRKDDFNIFERNFHIYICLDFLAYYLKTDDEAMCGKLTGILKGYLE